MHLWNTPNILPFTISVLWVNNNKYKEKWRMDLMAYTEFMRNGHRMTKETHLCTWNLWVNGKKVVSNDIRTTRSNDSLSLSPLFFGLPVRLHDNQKFRFLPADKRFLFFLLCECEWENVRVLLPASWASSSKWTRDMIWTVDSAAVIEISVPMVKCL